MYARFPSGKTIEQVYQAAKRDENREEYVSPKGKRAFFLFFDGEYLQATPQIQHEFYLLPRVFETGDEWTSFHEFLKNIDFLSENMYTIVMIIMEYKLSGTVKQYKAIEEAIRITQFIRNKCLRKWMDEEGISKNDLQCYCAVLAKEYSFACSLNSQARQTSADRAWFAISRFYTNCKEKKSGRKGYPQFQHDNRSVEYKNSGWKIEKKHITFTDGCGIGRLKLIGNKKQDIAFFPIKQIKRVRLLKRADGYYCQFVVEANRHEIHQTTDSQVGIDMGLKVFLTDSDGNTVENPRFLKKAEKKIKRLHRRFSKTEKKSKNRKKARQKLAKAYLKVQRQREDFARKIANTYISSHDLIAFENLQIRNMVKNHKLSKAIHDASWGRFLSWLFYYGKIHVIPVIGIEPAYTSQKCSGCGNMVKKALSERTHQCISCDLKLDRDWNAAKNILIKALCTVGHTETVSF